MKRLTLAIAALLLSVTAQAQIYQWKDENGKTVISDKPPTDAARLSKKIEATASDANAAPQRTAADREMEFRKRQKDAQEKAEKAQKEQLASSEKKENCENSRLNQSTLESGEPINVRDDKGERRLMDDAQRQKEIAKAQKAVQTFCK